MFAVLHPGLGAAPLVLPMVQAGNTAALAPTGALATGLNQIGLGFNGWNDALTYFRNANAFEGLIQSTLGPDGPLGLLPANLPQFNMMRQASSAGMVDLIQGAAQFGGLIDQKAAVDQTNFGVDLILHPNKFG